VKGISCWY